MLVPDTNRPSEVSEGQTHYGDHLLGSAGGCLHSLNPAFRVGSLGKCYPCYKCLVSLTKVVPRVNLDTVGATILQIHPGIYGAHMTLLYAFFSSMHFACRNKDNLSASSKDLNARGRGIVDPPQPRQLGNRGLGLFFGSVSVGIFNQTWVAWCPVSVHTQNSLLSIKLF